jgi:outer membrane protein TolC
MKRIFIFLSFLITSLFGVGQELNSLSLFEYAKKNSPQLLNSASDIYMSEQKINEVRASGLPKINGELSFQNFINVPTTVVPASAFVPGAPEDELIGLSFGTPFNANYNLKVSQLIFSFNYIYGLKAAENFSELSRLANIQKNQTVFEEIKLSLGKVIFLQKMQKLMVKNLEEIQGLINKTNKLVENGLVEKTSINDVLVIELDIKSGLEALKSNEVLAILSLKSLIGAPIDTNITLIKNFESSESETLKSLSMNPKTNNAVKIGEQNVILNRLNLKATQSEGYPSLYGFFNQQHMAMRNNFDFFDTSKDWYPATLWGVNVTVPIYNSGEGKAKRKQKELALLKSENELREIENQIFQLYQLLQNNYKNAYLNYENQKIKVGLVEKVYQNEEKKLGLGASNSLTLSQRKIQLLNAQQQLIQNEFELYKAEVQIKTHSNPIKL